jgi:M6 family metalloprotease-like protein
MNTRFPKTVLCLFCLAVFFHSPGVEACIGSDGTLPPLVSTVVERDTTSNLQGREVSEEPTLVILVEFSNRTGQTTQANWNREVFDTDSLSMRDYFRSVSYYDGSTRGLDLTKASETSSPNNNGVVGWYTIQWSQGTIHPYTVNYDRWESQYTRDIADVALDSADSDVDYASFDADGNGVINSYELHVIIVIAGFEASYEGASWPNTWRHHAGFPLQLAPTYDGVILCLDPDAGYCMVGELDINSTITEFGLIAHEMGHDLGLPDLYDVDTTNGWSNGIGEFGLMASGDWLPNPPPSGHQHADSPVHPCAWSKKRLGWLTPTTVSSNMDDASVYNIEDTSFAYRILEGREYFLVSNRQRIGYDAFLRDTGLAIWHIDDTVGTITANNVNVDETHKRVDLECADQDSTIDHVPNADDLDQYQNRGDSTDLYPSAGNNEYCRKGQTVPSSVDYSGLDTDVGIFEISAPGSTMTANIWFWTELNLDTLEVHWDYEGGGLCAVVDESGQRIGMTDMVHIELVEVAAFCDRLTAINNIEVPGQAPGGLAFADPFLWNADAVTDMIYEVDPTTGDVVRDFAAPGPNSGDLAWDGVYLWCVDRDLLTIFKVDPVTGGIVHSVPAPGPAPFGLAWKEGKLWCTDSDRDSIYQISPLDGTVVWGVDAPGPDPSGLAYDGEFFWVADVATDSLYGLEIGPTGAAESPARLTSDMALRNRPNPSRGEVTFSYAVKTRGNHVTLAIYDAAGARIRTLVDEPLSPGTHLATWDSRDDKGGQVPSGVYFSKLEAGEIMTVRKVMLLR